MEKNKKRQNFGQQYEQAYKDDILKKAHVLLISSNESDYEDLKNAGFMDIHYFKSAVVANKFLKDFDLKLKDYSIVILGDLPFSNDVVGNMPIMQRIKDRLNNKNQFTVTIDREQVSGRVVVSASCGDPELVWKRQQGAFADTIDFLLQRAFEAKVLPNESKLDKYYNPDKNLYCNASKLWKDHLKEIGSYQWATLPEKKEDVSILYVGNIKLEEADRIARQLGLNVTFKNGHTKDDKNFLETHLADYDIVIADQNSSLLRSSLIQECKEQEILSGKPFVSLITCGGYHIAQKDEDGMKNMLGIGTKLDFKYVHVCDENSDLTPKKEDLKVLRPFYEKRELSFEEKIANSREANLRATLLMALAIYAKGIGQFKGPKIDGVDLSYKEKMDQGYDTELNHELDRIEKEVTPIRLVDEMRGILENYLSLKNEGLIDSIPNNINIEDRGKCIYLETLVNGMATSTLVLPKLNSSLSVRDIKLLAVQVPIKEKFLGEMKIVAIYTKKYEKIKNLPPKPDYAQRETISNFIELIHREIEPLVQVAKSDTLYDEIKKPNI